MFTLAVTGECMKYDLVLYIKMHILTLEKNDFPT